MSIKDIKIKYLNLKNKLESGLLNGKEITQTSIEISKIEDIYLAIIKKEEIEEEINLIKMLESEVNNKEEIYNEIHLKTTQLKEAEQELQNLLLPTDQDDDKNVILEIRSAAGGDESGLFAAEIFHMYQKYSQNQKWKFEIYNITENGIGSYKEAIASISGRNVFKKLKFESGVHRVQRIPKTETQGRVHTSTVTVAILPEVNNDIDIEIPDKDIRIDTFRSSGAGGQHVNTTDSAVRITHLPTGIAITQQQKSQHQNRFNCMKILKSKLYDIEKQKQNQDMSSNRKLQIGTGDRSEKIRTYNFPQSRITDHRINYNFYQLQSALYDGNINEILNAITIEDQKQKLAEQEVH